MLKSLLNLKSITVNRETITSDGFGGTSAATSAYTLPLGSIWLASTIDATISDKITKDSTHVLATYYGAHTFTDLDKEIVYNGITYIITGHADNVANRNDLIIVGLKKLS